MKERSDQPWRSRRRLRRARLTRRKSIFSLNPIPRVALVASSICREQSIRLSPPCVSRGALVDDAIVISIIRINNRHLNLVSSGKLRFEEIDLNCPVELRLQMRHVYCQI